MRSLVIALLGAWIAGTLIMAAVATQNFRKIDRLLAAPSPEFSQAIAPLGHDAARLVLRHLSSELNRLYFGAWGLIQIVLGVLLLLGALGQKPLDRAGATGAAVVFVLAVVMLILSWLMGPLGRSLDFVPHSPIPPALARFRTLHLAYTALDATKLALCLWLLTRFSSRMSRLGGASVKRGSI